METPTIISMVRWSDTKAHSETWLFSGSKTKSDFFFFPLTDIWNGLDRIEEMHEVTALNFISLLFSWKHSPFCTRGSSWALWIVSTPEKWHSNVKPKKGKANLFDSALRFLLQVDLLKQKAWLSFHFESLYMRKSHYFATKKPLF